MPGFFKSSTLVIPCASEVALSTKKACSDAGVLIPRSTKFPEANSGSIKATLLSVQCSKIISSWLSIKAAKIGFVLPLVTSTSQP